MKVVVVKSGEVSCVSFLGVSEVLGRVSDVEIQFPNPVTIKPPPSKHENPFTKMVVVLWLGYELDCDED